MATRVSNFSDLIQRVTASCLLHPLANVRQGTENVAAEDGEQNYDYNSTEEEEEEEEEEKRLARGVSNDKVTTNREGVSLDKVMELERILNEVFDAVSAMKRAYVSLQEAHCPWDPERMRVADVAVVGELRKIAVLRERYKRKSAGPGGGVGVVGGGLVREVVAPYEAAVEELKREVKAREVEVENLKEKLNTVTSLNSGGKKGRSHSKRKVSCTSAAAQGNKLIF